MHFSITTSRRLCAGARTTGHLFVYGRAQKAAADARIETRRTSDSLATFVMARLVHILRSKKKTARIAAGRM